MPSASGIQRCADSATLCAKDAKSRLPAVISAVMSIGMVLLGLAFSIPVYEKMPYEYAYGAQTEYNPN